MKRSRRNSTKTDSPTAVPSFDRLGMTPEDRLNSALNLLFLLAQAYYKILECVVSSATWFCALDLELNESYLWTINNLKNHLANHDRRDGAGRDNEDLLIICGLTHNRCLKLSGFPGQLSSELVYEEPGR